MTPWFAAGIGFVIAAALALNSPHAVLTYRPNTEKCRTCQSAPSLATAKPGVELKTAAPARPAPTGRATRTPSAARPGHSPAALVGLEVDFRVVWRRNGAFGAVITLPVSPAHGDWRLHFEIPGTKMLRLLGARWQPAAGGQGGVASALTGRSPQPGSGGQPGSDGQPGTSGPPESWRSGSSAPLGGPTLPGPGDSSSPRDSWPGRFGPQDPREVRFLVIGTGSPVTPVDCVLNQAACHFG